MARGESQSELLVDFIISLDGYAAADDWPGLWGLGGPEYFAWLEDLPDRDHALLMGATTFRLMSGFAEADEDGTFAEMTARSKIVVSSTLDDPLTWENSRLVAGNAVEAVRALKDDGISMATVGSLSLCRSLLEAGLVDRIRLVVFPVITGSSGRERIYDGYPDVALKLVNSQVLDGRLQVLEYVPTVLTEPPGADAPMMSPVEDGS